jgi:ribosomal-protein-alanine N-acetyltransferase
MPDHIAYTVEPMSVADLDQVMDIEKVSFSAPWPRRAYEYEILRNEHSIMLVIKEHRNLPSWLDWVSQAFKTTEPSTVLGYAGGWLLVDEIHVSTIAVAIRWRRKGLAQLLLTELLKRGIALGARRATLEVRVSNIAAQRLYRKCGFRIVSKQKRYYADNEDAYIMATPLFDLGTKSSEASRSDTG